MSRYPFEPTRRTPCKYNPLYINTVQNRFVKPSNDYRNLTEYRDNYLYTYPHYSVHNPFKSESRLQIKKRETSEPLTFKNNYIEELCSYGDIIKVALQKKEQDPPEQQSRLIAFSMQVPKTDHLIQNMTKSLDEVSTSIRKELNLTDSILQNNIAVYNSSMRSVTQKLAGRYRPMTDIIKRAHNNANLQILQKDGELALLRFEQNGNKLDFDL